MYSPRLEQMMNRKAGVLARAKSGKEAFCGSLGLIWRIHQLCVLVSGLANGKWNV